MVRPRVEDPPSAEPEADAAPPAAGAPRTRVTSSSSSSDSPSETCAKPSLLSDEAAAALIVIGLPVILMCAQLMHRMIEMPGMALGKFAIRPGPAMASGAFFDITIRGRGSHGALPEQGIDPVLVACHVNTALQSIVSRNVPPTETAVIVAVPWVTPETTPAADTVAIVATLFVDKTRGTL